MTNCREELEADLIFAEGEPERTRRLGGDAQHEHRYPGTRRGGSASLLIRFDVNLFVCNAPDPACLVGLSGAHLSLYVASLCYRLYIPSLAINANIYSSSLFDAFTPSNCPTQASANGPAPPSSPLWLQVTLLLPAEGEISTVT
jgi:hypothetical protein